MECILYFWKCSLIIENPNFANVNVFENFYIYLNLYNDEV